MNMGTVFDLQGNHERALGHYRKALAIQLKELGPEHPQVGATYNNMAVVFYKQGEYDRALEFYRKALTISLKALGPEHPSVGDTYGNLAVVFKNQGDLDQALEHYRKALATQEKALGPEHPDTLNTVACMGDLARDSGDLAAAKALLVRAAEGFAKSLGPAHPQTMQAQAAVDELAASSEALAAALPLVKEIFAMFDADGDGKLSEEEYKAYLRGIGDAHDDDQWPEAWAEECKALECTMSEGITRRAFESALYGLAGRLGMAKDDLEKCKEWVSMTEEEQAERLRVQQAEAAEMRAATLPLVEEIFAMFDADGDGKLNEEEYKALSNASGEWEEVEASGMTWDEGWSMVCEQPGCADGITLEVALQNYIHAGGKGKAAEDLAKCKQALARTSA
eukprot:COSAG04_NODE_20_length_39202_cov_9.993530_26_plen_394_part_00